MPSKSAQAAGKRGILLTRVRGGEQKALSGTVLHLGRSAQNDYCITGNGSIGRKHAMLEKHGNDYFLKDMESVNGTYLNGMRINGGKPCKLKNGDRIRLADEEFIFEQL